jgi:hypothetical protein
MMEEGKKSRDLWKNGFITDAKLVFLAKRKSADYHD